MKIIRIIIALLVVGYPMFGFGSDKKIVKVQFIESGKSEPFAVSDIPLEQLPDTFEIDTTMHLGEEDWQVVSAEPPQKVQFRKKGSLKLFLKKPEIVSIDPKELLYSLPTIANDIAAVENAESLEDVAVFREDDWRQFEFLSIQYENEIEADLQGVLNIYKNHKVGIGFKEIHLRKKIPVPLNNANLKLESVIKHFSIKHKYTGVAFDNAAATIVGGFALLTKSNWMLWGQHYDAGDVLYLNITQNKDSDMIMFSKEVDSFMAKHNLYVVDWPGIFWAGLNKKAFKQYGR